MAKHAGSVNRVVNVSNDFRCSGEHLRTPNCPNGKSHTQHVNHNFDEFRNIWNQIATQFSSQISNRFQLTVSAKQSKTKLMKDIQLLT